MKKRLILFAKEPIAGQVKTRLTPALGAEGARDLYIRLAAHAFDLALQCQNKQKLELEIAYGGTSCEILTQLAGECFDLTPQSTGDLGQKMKSQMERAFAQGVEQVVLMGTDIPGISQEIIQEAFKKLQSHQIVLGPALDGGYYLIGLSAPLWDIFREIPWSTDQVLSQTLERIKALEGTFFLLEPLSDLDLPEDLVKFPELFTS